MSYSSHRNSFLKWLGLPPDTERPVPRFVKYRCTLLLLLYWGVLSHIPQGASLSVKIGIDFPFWGAALLMSPFIIVPAFLLLAVKTGTQWRYLMLTVYAGLMMNLLMNLIFSTEDIWGDLPAIGSCITLTYISDSYREWLISLPRFSYLWALIIYVFLSSNKTSPLLRLLSLAWWGLMWLIPINTMGMIGYADILGPLFIIAIILIFTHLSKKSFPHTNK